MEQPLQTLFLRDLRPDVEVTFRPWVFYAVFATGFILIFLIESFLLSLNFQDLGIRALPNPLYTWIALGLAAALASFKWHRSGEQAD